MAEIHQFHHRAMATFFEVRISDQERTYAAQAAQTAFDLVDKLESQLSRFRITSEIAQIARMSPGEKLRLSEPAFACLEIARRMESVTSGAFSVTPAAMQTQSSLPRWNLLPASSSIECESGHLQFDLGAVGKGFALDRMAEVLSNWDCPAYLLVAGGSSILIGDRPNDAAGWSCGLGDDNSPRRFVLTQTSLSGSGLAVKGNHILDPRTGRRAFRTHRTWAIADSAAESDALSTACMVMTEEEMQKVLEHDDSWLFIIEEGENIKSMGNRVLPLQG